MPPSQGALGHAVEPREKPRPPFPALPGCTSQGETGEEVLSMIREAIEAYIESLVAHGDPIPGPIEI